MNSGSTSILYTPSAERLTAFAELALQRIEAQHNFSLSRQIGTPNIASKGKLSPRTASVPLALFPVSHSLRVNAENSQKKLIEEIDANPGGAQAEKAAAPADSARPKGILKKGPGEVSEVPNQERPKFEWAKEDGRIKMTLYVPELVSSNAPCLL